MGNATESATHILWNAVFFFLPAFGRKKSFSHCRMADEDVEALERALKQHKAVMARQEAQQKAVMAKLEAKLAAAKADRKSVV